MSAENNPDAAAFQVEPIVEADNAAGKATCSAKQVMMPRMIELITAIGASRLGLALSPASWSACSNPR